MTEASAPLDMYWFLHKDVEEMEAEVLADVKQELPQHRSSPRLKRDEKYGDGVYTVFAITAHIVTSEITHAVLPTTSGLYDPVVNWVDGAVSILQGVKQVLDDETHRPLVTKVIGLSNISSGVGLTVITAVASTLGAAAAATLSAQGLAAAFAVAFLISCDEVVRSVRKSTDPEYWVTDSIKEWDKLNTKTIPKLKEEIARLEHLGFVTRRNSALQWGLERKKERLKSMEKIAEKLGEDIKDRVTTHPLCWEAYQTHFTQNDSLSRRAENLIGNQTDFTSSKKEKIEARIAKQNKKVLKEALTHSLMAGLAFTGMLLLCIPGGQPAAAVIIGITVALYMKKYAHYFVKQADKLMDKGSAKQPKDVEMVTFKK